MDFPRIGVGTYAGTVIFTLAAAMLLAPFSRAGQKSQSPSKANSAGAFANPVKTVTVDLGRTPHPPVPDSHTILTCYYFPRFMIKELDIQENIGSESLSILRSRNRLPPCRLSQEPGEKVINDWNGDFWGVKENLVFFSCAEFQQGKCSFAVYDSTTGKKLFADDVTVSDKDDDIHMQVFSTKAGVVAKYLTAVDVGCDLYAKGTDCWRRVKAEFGLKSDHKPVCEGYPTVYKEFEIDQDESMIGYPVEVTLSAHPAIKTVAGSIQCWPTH